MILVLLSGILTYVRGKLCHCGALASFSIGTRMFYGSFKDNIYGWE
jgi:hypothetical protein